MIRLHWNNGRLMQGKRYMPIEVLPDHQWPECTAFATKEKFPTWSISHAPKQWHW